MPSPTYTGFAILRSNLKSGGDNDIAKAVDYGKKVKVYPLSQADNPPETKFVDCIDTKFDSTIPYNRGSSRCSTASFSASRGSSATRR